MQKSLKIFRKHFPIILIIFCALALRLINLDKLFYFTYDESVFAFVGRRLVLWHHLPLIGGVTPFGVHVAPYFYWFFALILALGKLDPIAWGYFSALLGSATTALIFFVARDLFTKKIATVASILWGFSTLANIYDRHFWGLTFGPAFSLMVVFFLKKIVNKNYNFLVPLAISLALIIHADLSYLVFVMFSFCVWIYYRVPLKKFLIVICFISISLVPLIAFDLRHNFANSKPFLNYLGADKSASRFENQDYLDRAEVFTGTLVRFIYPTIDNEIAKQYSYCASFITEKYQNIPKILTLLSAIVFISFWIISFKSKKVGTMFIFIMTLIYFTGIQAYGVIFNGDIFEHYLTGLFPLIIIMVAYSISYLPKKLLLATLAIFVFFNTYKLISLKNSQGLENKKLAIQYVESQIGSEDFSLESVSTCWRYSGYRYLFAVYGKEPIKSYVDPNFGYLYGTTLISPTHPDKVIAIITHDFLPETDEFYKTYALYKSKEIKNSTFGNIEVIIMDNTSKWF